MNYSLESLLKELVSFRSDSNHPDEIQKCFDFAKQYLEDSGLTVRTYLSNNIPSLIAAKKIKKHYQYILNGHLDVVPADYPDAFKVVKKGTRVYARGTADMKGTAAVLMKLMHDLNQDDVDVALMLTFDEEIGGRDGVEYLLNKHNYSCDCVIVPDGGNNFHLTLFQKGLLHVNLQAQGKSAHGSRPWLGDNAIEKLFQAYAVIQKAFPLKRDDKENWQTTVNVGQLAGGSAANMVAAKAEMNLDFRYINDRDRNKIIATLDTIVKKIKGLSYKIVLEGNQMAVSLQNNYVKKIINIASKQGVEIIPEKSHTASDARFFSAKEIPVIMINPICSKGHINDEWIDIKSLEKYYNILREFLIS